MPEGLVGAVQRPAGELPGIDDPICVLHVDDEPAYGDLVARFLGDRIEDLTVESETSAAAALETLDAERVDCIVSDYQMPAMDGLAFLECVREHDPDVPFVLFTGQGSEAIASDAISAGVTDYLQKGVGSEQFDLLANRIRNAVRAARSRRRLAEREERYRLLAESTPDAIVTVDDDGRVRFANAAAEDVFGYAPANLEGRPLTDVLPAGFERDEGTRDAGHDREPTADDREPTDSDEPAADEPERSTVDERATRSVVGVHADGHELALELSVFAFEYDGVHEVTGVLRDVTARVERDQLFRGVFERSFDAMVIADDDGEYVDVNSAACELFGLSEDDLLGRSIDEFTPAEYDFPAAWAQFASTDRDRGLFLLVRDDGERVAVEFAATRDVVPGRHLSILRRVPGLDRHTDRRPDGSDADNADTDDADDADTDDDAAAVDAPD